jgi:CRP-like cAMP-binding protein
MQAFGSVKGCREQAAPSTGEFFEKLSKATLEELHSMMHSVSYPAGAVLFSEKDLPEMVYVVLEGEVKLSINSSEGKRLILRIAKKGEIVGIASALSGNSYDMTAETLYASKLAPIGRRDFLNFLLRHTDRRLPDLDRGAQPAVHPGVRSAAHRSALDIGAGEAGAPSFGMERERPENRIWNAVSFFTHAWRDWRVHRGLA